jgi:hypothetical protein
MKALVLVLLALVLVPSQAAAQQPASPPTMLDFESQGTPLVLQPLSPGRDVWDEEQSRKNFEAIRRVVVPGNPQSSMLLMMPLAPEAGSKLFHPGGKHWMSQDDPEWRLIADWIRGAK